MEDEWVDAFQGATVADLAAYYAARNGPPTEEVNDDSWTPRNLAELADTPPVQPTLGGLALCYPGKRHVFSGPQESAKTLAAYVVGLSVVRSGSSVVLIDFEMGPWDAKTRLRELGATDDELGRFLYVEPDTPALPQSTERLVGLEPALVIVDAAAGAFQLESYDDNSRRDVERWAAAWVNPFWKAGIATIVLDHVVKNVEGRGNYAIGSERKVGGADVHLGFSVITPIKRGSHGKYQITTHKDRGGHLKRGKLATFELTSDPETHHFNWAFVAAPEHDEEHPFRPTGLMEQVSRYVEMCFEPTSKNKIEQAVKGKTDYKRLAIALLEDEGFITISDVGVESARPFREDEDRFAPTSPHLAPEPVDKHLAPSPLPYRKGEGGAIPGGGGEPPTSPQEELDDDIPF